MMNDRGFASGEVGWGVLGNFGSGERDEGAQVIRKANDPNKKLVRNTAGLWVKQTQIGDDNKVGNVNSRGRGIPLHNDINEVKLGFNRSNEIKDGPKEGKEKVDKTRYDDDNDNDDGDDRKRRRNHRSTSPSRSESRKYRRKRSRSFGRSNSRSNSRSSSRGRSKRGRKKKE